MKTEFTLKLTLEQINVIVSGLGKLPMETAIYTFQEVEKQVRAQKKDEPKKEE